MFAYYQITVFNAIENVLCNLDGMRVQMLYVLQSKLKVKYLTLMC